jgi:hypothetical protein
MADEPDVTADSIGKFSPSTQIERSDRTETLEYAHGSSMRRM